MNFEEDTSVEKVVLGLTLFLNAGLALGSLALAMSFIFTDRNVSNLSILHPAIGYTIAAIIIVICLKNLQWIMKLFMQQGIPFLFLCFLSLYTRAV